MRFLTLPSRLSTVDSSIFDRRMELHPGSGTRSTSMPVSNAFRSRRLLRIRPLSVTIEKRKDIFLEPLLWTMRVGYSNIP